MNKKKSLITILVLVLIVGLSIAAGTFAYFQWTTGEDQRTGVNVTIEIGGIEMFIEPENTGFVGLYPTAYCENNVRYGDSLVTIVNNTGTLAIPSFKLKVKVIKGGSGELTSEALSHIHYSVVPIKTTVDGDGNPVKDEVNTTYSCSTVPTGSDLDDAGNILFSNADSWLSSLDFTSVSTAGEWSHIPTTTDKMSNDKTLTDGFLPRQYYLSGDKVGSVSGITFRGEAYTTSYQYYRVFVWMDEDYTTTIIGDDVTDPLQNAQIQVTWSEESMVQQVSGESNTTPIVLDAGLYDNSGSVVKTWQQLLNDGDITVSNNVITNSNRDLTGKLVIQEGITSIATNAFGYIYVDGDDGDVPASKLSAVHIPASVTNIAEEAFAYSSLATITFASGSHLATIGNGAFTFTNLTSIHIPSSVETIGSGAFSEGSLKNVTFEDGSRLTIISNSMFFNTNLESVVIPASVEIIEHMAFSSCSSLTSVTIEENSQLFEIGNFAFEYCDSLETIKFNGTKTKWNSISKEDDWHFKSLLSYIQCTDGNVEL